MTEPQPVVHGGWVALRSPGDDGASSQSPAGDLVNILDAVNVPIVVLRRGFTIRCFNEAAAEVLGLAPSHIDRSPGDVLILAKFAGLEERCELISTGGSACQADFRDRGKSFVVGIAPHKMDDGRIAGTVLTFTNVTALRASIDQAIYEREYVKAIVNAVADPLVVLNADERIQSGNRAFHATFRISRDEVQNASLFEVGNGLFAGLRTSLKDLLDGATKTLRPLEIDQSVPKTGQRSFVVDACLLSLAGQSKRIILMRFQDVTSRKKAEQGQRLLLGELQHRVKNSLSVVQAIALQTIPSAHRAEMESFTARLRALAKAHEVLTLDNWERAPVSKIVDAALDPFQTERIAVAGPNVPVDASKALTMALVLHELATNAVKYGALSNATGRVRVNWAVRESAEGARLELSWEERGGPAVKEPTKKGFGSRLIAASLENSEVRFAPEGISCTLQIPL